MNEFTTALRFNRPKSATPSALRMMDRLDLGSVAHADPEKVLLGFRLLTSSEAHRVPALIASLAEGRVMDVVNALADYYTPERLDAHHRKVATQRTRG